MKKAYLPLITAACVMLLSSCATSLSYKVNRPAELNLNGAKSIAVLPFGGNASGSVSIESSSFLFGLFSSTTITEEPEDRLASSITTAITHQFTKNSYFELVPSRTVEAAINTNRTAPVDAYITGYVERLFAPLEYDEITSVPTEDGGTLFYKPVRRTAYATFVIQIVDARTNRIISYKVMSTPEVKSDWYQSSRDVPSADILLVDEVEIIAREIAQMVMPKTVTMSVTLLEDKDKNPAMQNANEVAKNGSWATARDMYYSIYENEGLFEAGYNAAVISQAMGNLYEAKLLLKELITNYGDSRAVKQLSIVEREIQYQEQYNAQQGIH